MAQTQEHAPDSFPLFYEGAKIRKQTSVVKRHEYEYERYVVDHGAGGATGKCVRLTFKKLSAAKAHVHKYNI